MESRESKGDQKACTSPRNPRRLLCPFLFLLFLPPPCGWVERRLPDQLSVKVGRLPWAHLLELVGC